MKKIFNTIYKSLQFKNNHNANKGFALIETAIAIVVMGILITSVSHIFLSIKRYSLVKNEKHNTREIIYAIAEYLLRNKCLPVPKDYTKKDNLLIGSVNYEELGIGKMYTFDRFSKPIKYIVDQELTIKKDALVYEDHDTMQTSGNLNVFCDDLDQINLKVYDSNSNCLIKGRVIFVLLRSNGDTDHIQETDCIFWTSVYGFMLKYLRMCPLNNK